MARIALIKLFAGLNMAPAQLSGELQRTGHESLIIYFKDYRVVPIADKDKFSITDYPGIFIDSKGRKMVWNCYTPFSKKDMELLVQELRAFQPDAIGLSVISGIINESAFVTAELKQHFPEVPVIWGGPGPTLEPERCIQLTDIICINEGEEVIVELANALDAGTDMTTIAGTWAKTKDGSVVKNPERPLLNLDKIAIPDWNIDRYMHINSFKGVRRQVYPANLREEYPIMTQRGCPFSCAFCIESRYQEMFGKKDSLRRRSSDVVLEELRWAKQNLNIKSVLFYDDVFTVNPRWLKEFLPRYKAEIGLPFWCYTYPTTHTPELLHLLKDAGMISVTMGVQSGSARILREYFNRPTERNRVLEAAQEIVDLGPDIKGFFDLITKVPFETEDDLRETFEFLLELPIELRTVGFGEMNNFPTYSFSRKIDENESMIAVNRDNVSEAMYDFYNKLYLITRTNLPRDEVRAIYAEQKYRDNPALLDDLINNEKYGSFTGISF